MKTRIGLAASAAALTAGAVAAAPAVDIHNAVARVTIIPEARSDIAVSVVKVNARLPLSIARIGDSVSIDGGLGGRWHSCHASFGHARVAVWGLGDIGYDDMPQIVIRTPMDVKVSAGAAVFGTVGRGASVDLANSGCGDWTVGNVSGPLRVSISGSGDVRAGGAGAADVRVSGSADVWMRDIRGGLRAAASGSGDIHALSISGGPLHVRVAGSGDVDAKGGAVTDMDVSVSGSGDVNFGGVAQTLTAAVAGSGDVKVGRVTGAVSKHVAGSGSVEVGG